MCNITFRCFRVIIVVVEKQKIPYSECLQPWVSNCNAHAPYCRLWPTRVYNNIPPYVIQCTFFEKKKNEHKLYVLMLSATLGEIFPILKEKTMYYHNFLWVFMQRYPFFRQIFIKLEQFSKRLIS